MTSWLDRPRWLPVDAPLKGTLPRSRGQLLAVVAQFEVEKTARYQRTPGATYCNIFSWDVTRALRCEIPHWVNSAGDPVPPGRGGELSANLTLDWLKVHGPRFLWTPCSRDQAADAAERGEGSVAVWANPNPRRSGHIAVGVPAVEAGVFHIAQAGFTCFTSAPLAKGFGSALPVFFTHP